MTGHIEELTMAEQSLFSPLRVGAYELSHRVVMAPLTRMRSQQPGNIPTSLNATYYGQRSTPGGLIIAEATQISPSGQGYPGTPGIHSPEQIAGWRLVTDAVHDKGGLIFLQLWHVGRISHPSHQPNGILPVAPSAIRPEGSTLNASWEMVPFETPRALDISEIPGLIDDYRAAAANALAAGFDGVEIHSANGYLLDQFLQDKTNTRTDAYGGSIPNRVRLLLEVVDAVIGVWGADKVGVRLSPYGTFNDMGDSNPVELFTHAIASLSERGIAYLHLVEPRSSSSGGSDEVNHNAPEVANLFKSSFAGTLIAAGGFTGESASQSVMEGKADAIAFGRMFISNPDLPHRLKLGVSLNRYDRATFYGGSEQGYTDYPSLLAS